MDQVPYCKHAISLPYKFMFVTEIIGISLIWMGYLAMAQKQVESIHPAQQAAMD